MLCTAAINTSNTTRTQASALYAMALYPCLCPSVSVTSLCSIDRDGRIDVGFGMHGGFFSTSPTLRCKEIHVSTK